MALVQLSEDGLIDLDTPVREILPEIAIDNPWKRRTRCASFICCSTRPDSTTCTSTRATFRRRAGPLARGRVEAQPEFTSRALAAGHADGVHPGYGVAGFILETIAAKPYEDYIEREIFDPLEMTTSSFS